MANVPRAQIPVPQTGGGFGGVRVPTQAPAGAFGGGEDTQNAFGASSALANEAGGIFRQHLEEAIQSETADNLSKLSAEETRLKTSLSNVRGKDALQAQQDTLTDFDNYHGNLSNSIGNPEVSKAVALHYQQFKTSLNAWGTQYANGQFRQYQDESDASLVQSEKDAAIADGNPERIKLAIDRQEAAIKNTALRNGWSPEKVQLATADARSGTHFGVLDSMLAQGMDLAGKDYFEKNKAEFVGQDLIKAEKMVRSNSKLGEATRLVDKAFEPSVGPALEGPAGAMGMKSSTPGASTAEDLIKFAKTIDDPDVRKEFMSQGRQRLDDMAHAKHQEVSSTFDAIAQRVQDPKNQGINPRDLATPDQWENKLTPQTRDALMRMAQKERVTDDQTEIQWWALQADPRKVAALDSATLWSTYLSKFSAVDAKAALSQWSKARQEVAGDPLKASETKSAYSDKEMILASMGQIGAGGISQGENMESVSKNGDKSKAFASFFDRVDNAWMTFQQRNNGKIGDLDRKRILAELLASETPVTIETVDPYFQPSAGQKAPVIGTVTKPFRDLSEEERKTFNVQYGGIAPAVVNDMTNFVSSLGKPVTPDKLQRMRRARLLGDDAAFLKIANE